MMENFSVWFLLCLLLPKLHIYLFKSELKNFDPDPSFKKYQIWICKKNPLCEFCHYSRKLFISKVRTMHCRVRSTHNLLRQVSTNRNRVFRGHVTLSIISTNQSAVSQNTFISITIYYWKHFFFCYKILPSNS